MRSLSVREFRVFLHARRRCSLGVPCFMWCKMTDRWHYLSPHRSRQFGLNRALGFDELNYALHDQFEDRCVTRVRAEPSTGYHSMMEEEEDDHANIPEMEDDTGPADVSGITASAMGGDVSIMEEPAELGVIHHEVPAARPEQPQPVPRRYSPLEVYGIRIRSPCGLSQLNVDLFDTHSEAYRLSAQLAQLLQLSMNRGAFGPDTNATIAAIIEERRSRRNLGIQLRAAAGSEIDLSQLNVEIHSTEEAYVENLFELLLHAMQH